MSNKPFQTPSTCGATGEQLEFDFGPEFQKVKGECIVETNSTLSCSETSQKLDGITKTKDGSQ